MSKDSVTYQSLITQSLTELSPIGVDNTVYEDITVSSNWTPIKATPNLVVVGAIRSFFFNDRRLRIRQTGTLKSVKFYYKYLVTTTAAKYQIWRKISSVYTLIHDIDIFSSLGTGNDVISISINNIAVKEGDYQCLVFTDSSTTQFLTSTATDAVSNSMLITNSDESTGADWDAGINLALLLYIEAYMSRPYIVGIGDSIMGGGNTNNSFVMGNAVDLTDLSHQILYQLRALDSVFVYQNAGVSSDTTSEIYARLEMMVIEKTPTYCLINGGVNDIDTAVSEAVTVANIVSMVNDCNAAGIIPMYLHVFPWSNGINTQMQSRDSLISAIDIALASLDVLVINMDTTIGQFRIGGDPGNLWDIQPIYDTDGVHLNELGYTAVAQKIYNEI